MEIFQHFMFRSEKMAVTTCHHRHNVNTNKNMKHHRHNVRARTDFRAQEKRKAQKKECYVHRIDVHIDINLDHRDIPHICHFFYTGKFFGE